HAGHARQPPTTTDPEGALATKSTIARRSEGEGAVQFFPDLEQAVQDRRVLGKLERVRLQGRLTARFRIVSRDLECRLHQYRLPSGFHLVTTTGFEVIAGPSLASRGSRRRRTRGPMHDSGDPAPLVLESRVYSLRGSRFLRSREAGSLPEDEGFQEPVASETVGAVDAGVGAASTGVESRDARGAIGVDLGPTHRAVRHRAHRDRVLSRIDPGLRLDDVAGEGKPALELLAVEVSQIEGDELGWPADDLFFGGPSH